MSPRRRRETSRTARWYSGTQSAIAAAGWRGPDVSTMSPQKYIAAENLMGFQAPQEAARILGEVVDDARQGAVSARSWQLGHWHNAE